MWPLKLRYSDGQKTPVIVHEPVVTRERVNAELRGRQDVYVQEYRYRYDPATKRVIQDVVWVEPGTGVVKS